MLQFLLIILITFIIFDSLIVPLLSTLSTASAASVSVVLQGGWCLFEYVESPMCAASTFPRTDATVSTLHEPWRCTLTLGMGSLLTSSLSQAAMWLWQLLFHLASVRVFRLIRFGMCKLVG